MFIKEGRRAITHVEDTQNCCTHTHTRFQRLPEKLRVREKDSMGHWGQTEETKDNKTREITLT